MLYELVRKQNLSLTDSLEIISKFKGNGCVGKAASYVLDCLKNGIVFSSALKTCNHIEFDNISIMEFVKTQTGNCMKDLYTKDEKSYTPYDVQIIIS